jgi:cytochrome c oxidase assembly factor CtaG
MTTIIIILAYAVGGVVFYRYMRGPLHKEGKWTVGDRLTCIAASLFWLPTFTLMLPFIIVEKFMDESPAKW